MTGESLGRDNKDAQEYEDEGETKVDKVIVKVIKRKKSYDVAFQKDF